METKTKTTEFVPDKQSPTRQSLEEGETQSEVSVDYAGASRKTDPAEIALVRKLDLCMMVSFQCPTWIPCCHSAFPALILILY